MSGLLFSPPLFKGASPAMTHAYDISSVCNALVDFLVQGTEEDLETNSLTKGCMHLLPSQDQEKILKTLGGRSRTFELGGSSLNVMRALAALGQKVAFAGMVGEDSYGDIILKRMAELKIEPFLVKHQKEPTGVCLVLVTPDGERTMITSLGASRLYGLDAVPLEAIGKSRMFHFCGYQWDTEGQKAAILKALSKAEQTGALISFDLSDPFVVSAHREDFLDLIQNHPIHVLFANKEEARHLVQKEGATLGSLLGQKAGVSPIAVTKLGAQGAMIEKLGQAPILVPALPVKVVDTTGAGDMFGAGFLFGLLHGKSLPECGRLATLLARDVISRMGATLSEEALEECRLSLLPK
jgi:sugar/nucleoside kinase (ribokinase family)